MCGRYSLTTEADVITERFVGQSTSEARLPARGARYNVAPSQPVWAVVHDEEPRIVALHWGLIPSWAKDKAMGTRMINARSEGIAEKPSFRRAIRTRRCLVLADGFYEWKQEGSFRVPHYIRLKSREPFGFAGLWESWSAPSGETIQSCAIITTAANAFLKRIHHRMPVILPREAEAHWLNPDVQDHQNVLPLLRPYPADDVEGFPVTTVVNAPHNDVPACTEPAVAGYHGDI